MDCIWLGSCAMWCQCDDGQSSKVVTKAVELFCWKNHHIMVIIFHNYKTIPSDKWKLLIYVKTLTLKILNVFVVLSCMHRCQIFLCEEHSKWVWWSSISATVNTSMKTNHAFLQEICCYCQLKLYFHWPLSYNLKQQTDYMIDYLNFNNETILLQF